MASDSGGREAGGVTCYRKGEGEMREPIVTAKCVGCGHRREIKAGEVPKGEFPMCEKCFSPMVAESAVSGGVA